MWPGPSYNASNACTSHTANVNHRLGHQSTRRGSCAGEIVCFHTHTYFHHSLFHVANTPKILSSKNQNTLSRTRLMISNTFRGLHWPRSCGAQKALHSKTTMVPSSLCKNKEKKFALRRFIVIVIYYHYYYYYHHYHYLLTDLFVSWKYFLYKCFIFSRPSKQRRSLETKPCRTVRNSARSPQQRRQGRSSWPLILIIIIVVVTSAHTRRAESACGACNGRVIAVVRAGPVQSFGWLHVDCCYCVFHHLFFVVVCFVFICVGRCEKEGLLTNI